MKATIFDVAKRAGVSIKTVSRVVNREPNVRETTRARVEKAVNELRYRPDRSARNLASQRSHLIGLIYDDPAAYALPSSGYIVEIQQGALQACRAARRELLIHPCNFRRRSVATELKALIGDTRLAGIVLAAPLSNMPRIVRAIEATNTPFVRLSPGKPITKQPSVATNDREISAEMTRYIAGLGHRRIAFIKGDPRHVAVNNRFLGYQDGLEQSGIRPSQRLVVEGDNSFLSGEACGRQLLQRKRRPTAIFAASDDMAAGVLRTAGRLGISVPGELSVAGFDDITLSRQVDPLLTTIHQPLERMAERAVTMLIEAEGSAPSQDAGGESIPATLCIRESTGPAPGQD